MRSTVTALGAALALAAAGCGDHSFAGGSPEEIMTTAHTAMGELESMRVQGHAATVLGRLEFELSLDRQGDCTGTYRVGQGVAQVRGQGGETWIRADVAFFETLPGDLPPWVAREGFSRWASTAGGPAELTQLCDLESVVDSLVVDSSELQHAGREDVGGQEAVHLRAGTRPHTASVFVATRAPHHIIGVATTGDLLSEMELSRFDEPVDVRLPPGIDDGLSLA